MTAIDKATDADKFGFEPYVKGITDFIRQTESDDLPITIGIYGAWGSGKTSFIKQMKKDLKSDTPYKLPTVWFEAWKYDRTSDVRSALIFYVLSSLHAEANSKTKEAIKYNFKKIAAALKTLTLQTQVSIGVEGVGITSPPLGQVIEDMESADGFRTSVDDLEKGFRDAVVDFLKECKGEKQKKLIIFIDDLDRCLPEHVITVLEALKLFLDDAPCVFVIAVDRTVVEKAVKNHYGTDPGVSGRDYLDKIVQFPFTVPPPSSSDLKACFGELINLNDISEKCLQVFNRTAEGNPRIYLRLINSWRLYSSLAPHTIPSVWNDVSKRHVLAIAIALHLRWPDLHEASRNNPQGLITLTEYCMNRSATFNADKAFTNSNGPEFQRFWDNSSLRNYLNDLRMVGKGTGEIFISDKALKTSLDLSSRSS